MHPGGKLEGQIDLVKKKQAAIRLLSGDNRSKARSIRQQIEEIDLSRATSRNRSIQRVVLEGRKVLRG